MMARFFPLFVLLFLASCIGTQAPAPVTIHGSTEGAGSAGVHTVVDGDTLWSVSNRYGIPMRDIAIVNRVDAPFTLAVGQRLKLPPPQYYKVKNGDTLYRVSRIFDVDQFQIARENHLQAPYVLREGQNLRLPSAVQGEPVYEVENMPAVPAKAVQVVKVDSQGRVVKPASKPVRVKNLQQKKKKITARTPARSSSKFLSPVQGKVISSYGPKKGGLHNDGINIAAPRGSAVKAAENGVVVYAGSEIKGSGNLILVRHADRWMTAYAHLDKFAVKRGDVIKRGAKIGTVGSTGSVSSPQLHFEVRRGTEAINPKRYL